MQLTYYDDETPPWTWWRTGGIDLDHASAEVAHGYTLGDLDRLSRIAARRTFGGHISYTDRYWLACSAMSEHLLAAEGPPTSRDLLRWRSTSWPVMATGIRRYRPTCPTWRSPALLRRSSGWCGRRARTSPGTAHPDRWGWRREQQKARPLPGAGSKGRRSRGFGVAFQAADLFSGVSEGVGDVGLLDAACSEGADDAAEVESGLSDGGFGLVDSCDGCSEFGHVGLFHGPSVAQCHVANFRYATRG